MSKLHGGFSLELLLGEIPDVDVAVASSTGRKDTFVGVPLGEQDVASVFRNHKDELSIGMKRNFRQTKILL